MPPFGPTELIVIFGAGRLAEVGGAIGRSVGEFRDATEDSHASTPGAGRPSEPSMCKTCGVALHSGARFCGSCGRAVAAETVEVSQVPPATNPPASRQP
jgi:hypothetical protein